MARSAAVQERQRQRVRRRYHRFFVDANESRALVQQLIKKRNALLASLASSPLEQPVDRALQQYVEAIAVADQLRDEKRSLVKHINEREMLQHQISHIMGDWDTFTSLRDMDNRVMVTPRPSLNFRPLTAQDCRELTSAYFCDVRRSMRAQFLVKTEQSIFGWSDATQVNDRCINFSLQKTLTGYTPSELSKRSWELVSSPSDYASVYSTTFSSATQMLQLVDEDNIVIYERWSRKGIDELCHSLFLISRLQIEGGYAEVCQPLDPSRIQWPSGMEALTSAAGPWVDTDYWTLYEDCLGDETATHVTTGGKIVTSTDEDTNYWMVELLLIAMRWESLIVGPRFRLSSSEPEESPAITSAHSSLFGGRP